MEVGRNTENVFYAFIELMSDVLGFTVTKDTTRNKVGKYFSGLGKKLEEASEELEEVASKAIVGVEVGVDKGEESKNAKNPVRIAVDIVKGVLALLKTHLESLKDIGDGNKVVDVANNQNGVAANSDALKKLYQALKGIVTASTTEGVAEPKKNNIAIATANVGGTNAKNGAKVLATGAAGAATGLEGLEAAAIVSAVNGEEILAAIFESGESDAAVVANATADTSAISFAKGGQAANLAQDVVLAGAVSGGIALRSLIKEGKLASHNENSDEKAVQSAGITAVNELLVAVEDIIKKTVKNVLEKVKKEVDKARDPKAVGQQ
ncbi:Variable major outer membrane lipoprotein (plasmid) [Borrelia crocidurae DOU]|uniref:Variable large protein n=1 Tax=Borrelia crocidurae DOU TaxID=1293575 RepID=W5SMR2_9SPIR|nr:Variable major outer membrane lipoprotein [Borrelia crocidurae DOU]